MQNLRDQVIRLLGDFPRKVDLEPETSESVPIEGGCRRLLVSYYVEEGERVPAYLLVPRKGEEKMPGIVAIHQHAGQFYLGKSEPAGLSANRMYHYGLDLCHRGYVVLCPDLLCFEDRRPKEFERREGTKPDEGWYERFKAMRLLLKGSSLQTKYLSDLTRAIDFLETIDYVDADRIGTIGHSMGGQEATWLTWYDKRVKVGVSSCGISLISTILRDSINHNMAMYVPGLLKVADMDDLVCGMAPRAFFMANGEKDRIFPLDGVRKIAQRAKDHYRQLGAEEKFECVTFPAGHSFPDEVKEKAYAFMDKWLKEGRN